MGDGRLDPVGEHQELGVLILLRPARRHQAGAGQRVGDDAEMGGEGVGFAQQADLVLDVSQGDDGLGGDARRRSA
ncbi:MAG: hypothetical protein ACYC1D_11505, partial [Acidimicrobiales bacterium]